MKFFTASILFLFLFCQTSLALDNSDAPDFFSEFEAKAKPFILKTENATETPAVITSILQKTPNDYVWHHVEDGKTMQLIPKNVHKAFPHTGGSSVIRNGM